MESKFGHDPASVARWEIHGPSEGHAVVAAWADDYIRFDNLPPWQKQLREEICSRCRLLNPAAGHVLQAVMAAAGPYANDVIVQCTWSGNSVAV